MPGKNRHLFFAIQGIVAYNTHVIFCAHVYIRRKTRTRRNALIVAHDVKDDVSRFRLDADGNDINYE